MIPLSEQHIKTIKDAAKKLTGAKKRAFQAQAWVTEWTGVHRCQNTI
jgi:hypothetical protein